MKEENPHSVIKPFPKSREFEVEIHRVPIHWDLEKGILTFFGMDSALFWTDPSIVNMLAPIMEELGKDLFRLLVAYSSSLGTEEDSHAMISTMADNFKDGFLAWGQGVSTAGWGSFELRECNPDDKQALVVVRNSWEVSVQRNLPPEKRWGAPFLQGKLIGIFSNAFGVPCWANDTCYYDPDNLYTEIRIFPSNVTIKDELKKLRYERMLVNERDLTAKVDQRTAELQRAMEEVEQYSATLEQKVAERTAELIMANNKLEKEIETRKDAEIKLEEANRELLALSITDKLTGIGNRRHFDTVLVAEWSRAQRTNNCLALFMGDVDWFKKYNDAYGHQAGDECLRLVSQVLKNNAKRETDVVARYGGEEFSILLPNTSADQAMSIAEKLIQGFHDLNLPHSGSQFGYVTMSFGISVITPMADQDVGCLLKTADVALYSAKEKGRNQYVLWNNFSQ
jgi:diguanylate cyclase (GGDEF) domain